MNIESHVSTLTKKHTVLEHNINQEEQRPIPDSVKLTALKKEKLKIKDQLRSFR